MDARLARLLRAVTNDDGTGAMWKRLTPDGRAVLRLAFAESGELGHCCLADEHVLLGLLRHGASPAAALLQAQGLGLAAARAELLQPPAADRARLDPWQAQPAAAAAGGARPRPQPTCRPAGRKLTAARTSLSPDARPGAASGDRFYHLLQRPDHGAAEQQVVHV